MGKQIFQSFWLHIYLDHSSDVNLFICLFIIQLINSFLHSFLYSFCHPFIHSFIQFSQSHITSFIFTFIYRFIYLLTNSFNCLAMNLSIYFLVHSSIFPLTHPSFNAFIFFHQSHLIYSLYFIFLNLSLHSFCLFSILFRNYVIFVFLY